MQLHVGLDDTDSVKSGCTTYITSCLIEVLHKKGYTDFLDFPNLIRLNPNITWKTRGNGATCLRLNINSKDDYTNVEDVIIDFVEKNFERDEETNPGVAFLEGEVPTTLKNFSSEALWRMISIDEALRVARSVKCKVYWFNDVKGIVGALAAIGETLDEDHTYEVLTYRRIENRGKPRRIDLNSVWEMDKLTKPLTFNNIDYETGRVLITPRGGDPVLYGVRGENSSIVKYAMRLIKVYEPVERWTIFRSNQGTDAHLRKVCKICEVKPYSTIILEGYVSSQPLTVVGGHVIFKLKDETGEIYCAAYEPTGKFRNVVRSLIVGDKVRVYGGLRKASPTTPTTVNLEKIEILSLAKKVEEKNPPCPICNKRMTSLGLNKGFKCEKCGYRNPMAKKVLVEVERNIKPTFYIPPPRSQRHLTKPYERYGQEKTSTLKENKKIQPKNFWGLGYFNASYD
ncbi:MAG: TiaS agmantine-binding domain-containing protein [Candidatus Bathyarchaeota archaeon]